jgi:hypothetical protein
MLRAISAKDLEKLDLVPHAVIRKPLSYFRDVLGIRFIQAQDDLDEYEGAALSLDGGQPLALRHYRGYPADTMAVYLPFELHSTDEISRIIGRLIEELRLSRDAIDWQRSDNPDL